MAESMQHWVPRPRPQIAPMEGRFVRIEKLNASHADELFDASTPPDGDVRFRWLPNVPPTDRSIFKEWVQTVAASEDPIFYAAIDKASGKVAGRQTFMRIDAQNGVAEIGHIYWGPLISRRPATTEALFLFARHIFDELGYRRFEWRCDNLNEPSKKAAKRFGFQEEGVFRQHLIVKGLNRDTSWFAILDKDWTTLRPAYEQWMSPDNFDENGQQKHRLEELRGG